MSVIDNYTKYCISLTIASVDPIELELAQDASCVLGDIEEGAIGVLIGAEMSEKLLDEEKTSLCWFNETKHINDVLLGAIKEHLLIKGYVESELEDIRVNMHDANETTAAAVVFLHETEVSIVVHASINTNRQGLEITKQLIENVTEYGLDNTIKAVSLFLMNSAKMKLGANINVQAPGYASLLVDINETTTHDISMTKIPQNATKTKPSKPVAATLPKRVIH